MNQPRIAVLIPCYNEEVTVAQVVRDFHDQLPNADIYVFDNNSTDRTVELAREAGAIVAFERRQGKGYAVQTMFQNVEADIYVMVDGDNTYPAADVHKLIEPLVLGDFDQVVGSRLTNTSASDFKHLNRFGNHFFLYVLNLIFKVQLTDILSGYRAFNRRFVKNIPIFGGGFEVETELTIKSLGRGYRILEVPIDLTARPAGSFSKIRILHDGFIILTTILTLFRDYKPLTFFGAIGLVLIATGFVPGIAVIVEFVKTGLVPRLPSAVLAVGLVLSGMLMIVVGLVLHTITRRFQELDHQMKVLVSESGISANSRMSESVASSLEK
jgi:glycosyltransferase involved in cell wall biosynthesis